MRDVQFRVLKGKTLKSIENVDNELLIFTTSKGYVYEMYHEQDCCESVNIEDIVGELDDLIGTPILMAQEVSEDDPEASESGTWTFYKLATIKGYVTIRWYGCSNGYYSERVDFIRTSTGEKNENATKNKARESNYR